MMTAKKGQILGWLVLAEKSKTILVLFLDVYFSFEIRANWRPVIEWLHSWNSSQIILTA
jgi:hypothetical protein